MTYRFLAISKQTKQNKTRETTFGRSLLSKKKNDYSLIWLIFYFNQWPWPRWFYIGSSNVTWISGEFEKKHKSAMRNCTLSTFILLGLTDDPPMQVLIFMFLFVSIHWVYWESGPILILTLVDSHLKTAM